MLDEPLLEQIKIFFKILVMYLYLRYNENLCSVIPMQNNWLTHLFSRVL